MAAKKKAPSKKAAAKTPAPKPTKAPEVPGDDEDEELEAVEAPKPPPKMRRKRVKTPERAAELAKEGWQCIAAEYPKDDRGRTQQHKAPSYVLERPEGWTAGDGGADADEDMTDPDDAGSGEEG